MQRIGTMPVLIMTSALLIVTTGCRQATQTAAPVTASSRPPVKLKLVSAFQTSLPVLGTNITYMAERLEKASGGTMTLKVYEPGALVNPFEILDAVNKGSVDAGYAGAGYWTGKLRAAPLFSAIPFGPETGEYLAWMYRGNGLKLYQEMYDTAGFKVKVLICAIIPPETSGWFTKPINSVEDLQGLKIRFYGLGALVMQKLGAEPTLFPGGEIFQNLEKGVIDATEYSMPVIDEQLGFYKIAKYNYFPGWHQQATIFELLVNKDVWNGLQPDRQALLEMCCRDGIVRSIAVGEASQYAAMRKSVEKHGVNIMYWSDEMLELYRRTWEEVARQECAEDPFFKKVWDDLSEFRKNYDFWEAHAFLPRSKLRR